MTGCNPVIQTGFPINAAKEQEKPQYRLLFGPDSTDPVSHVIEANHHAFLVQAFNLSVSDVIQVEMVAGYDSASYAEPIQINGKYLELTATNNLIFLPWPLRYQLRKVQGTTPLGSFVVYAVPVPFAYVGGIANAG